MVGRTGIFLLKRVNANEFTSIFRKDSVCFMFRLEEDPSEKNLKVFISKEGFNSHWLSY